MTDKVLFKKSNQMLKHIQKALDDDMEVTIDGNGYNSHEASGVAKWYAGLIETYIKDKNNIL